MRENSFIRVFILLRALFILSRLASMLGTKLVMFFKRKQCVLKCFIPLINDKFANEIYLYIYLYIVCLKLLKFNGVEHSQSKLVPVIAYIQ